MFDTFLKFLVGDKEKEHANEIKKMKKVLEAESLTCKKCNNISYPVWGTKNKYKCTNCNNRFTNSNHYIVDKALEEFNIGIMQYSQSRENRLKKIYEEIVK